jgi:AraC family ethanolamine operon transcriptional activator
MNEGLIPPVHILLSQQFDDFEELADMAVSWDADFRQLSAEHFKPEVFQAQVDSILVSNARFGCHVDQRGATPAGMRTFALPELDCPDMRWFGHTVGQGVLLVFPSHGEIAALSRPGFGVSTFSIPEDLLVSFFEQNGGPELSKVLKSGETIVPASPLHLKGLRYQLRQLQALAQNGNGLAFQNILSDEIQNQILFFLLEILTGVNPASMMSGSGSHRTIDAVLDYIHAHPTIPLSIGKLCTIAQVSERTLQVHFKRELGMTPKTYLVAQRLNGARRELWRADTSTVRIADAANNWGFWHMGQFAADYRRLFGELPNETLKRVA